MGKEGEVGWQRRVDLAALPSTPSHHGGACCCKLTPHSTHQSGSGGLFERKRMGLLRCFYTAVPLQCRRVLEDWRRRVHRVGNEVRLYGRPPLQ